MFWTIFGSIIFFLALGYLIVVYIMDRRHEKKSVTEAMSKELWDEIADEREVSLEQARKFKDALENARQKASKGRPIS